VHAARSGNLKDEMFAMFDAKDEGQLSDDDLLLQSWDDLKRPSKFYNGYNEVDHYVKQGNLAEYLGLKAVRAIHVPIPVNLIFIGFNGSGDHGMRMREGDMRRWLQRMDHVEEHTRAPLNWPSLLARLSHTMGAGGELVRSDDDDDEEEGEGEGEGLEHDLPLISSVHYNYTVHVMEMGERVASVFEAAVRTLSRPDDPTAAAASHDDDDDPADSPPHPHHPSSASSSGTGGAGQQHWYQVDMGAMAHVVDSLVDSLQLDASAYNVIVLNLNRARARKRYGYRLGLSNAEFNMLKSDDRMRQHLLSPGLEKVPQVLDEQHVPQPLFSSRPGHKLAWRYIEPHEILPWAARVTALLGTVERVVSERGDPRANAARKAQQLLTSGDPRRARALRAALQEADASWQEQCLTDTWIGTRRWALMDLSAGPFSWGPLSPAPHRPAAAATTPTAPLNTAAAAAVGAAAGGAGGNGSSSSVMGDGWSSSSVVAVDVGVGGSAAWGVRSEASLPSVDRYFHALSHASLGGCCGAGWAHRWVGAQVGGRTGGWAHRWVGAQVGGRAGGWARRWVGAQVGGRAGGWAHRWVGAQVGGRTGGWARRWVGAQVGGRTGGWAHRWVGAWVGGRMVNPLLSCPLNRPPPRVCAVRRAEAWEGDLRGRLERMAEERLEAVEEGEGEGGEGQHAVDVLLAELDVYHAFAARHCSHRAVPSALCRELQQKLEEVKDDLAKHQGGSGMAGSVFTGRSVRAALERLHSWKFQSVPPDRHAGKGEAGESSPAVTRAWDMLMAELAATLASAMRHVITPSTAAGAYHFYERVSFHLYIISHQAYYERRHTPQYVEDFKAEVQKLSLPGQRFHFSTYRLSVAEDAALATAFSASLRAAVLPSASAGGKASAGGRVQLYVDSHVLQHQLRSLGDDSLQRLKRSRGERAQLDVPVFFFAIASDPILIDQSLLAKSLPDMVLSVQLPQRHWPTGVTCNGKEMHADLRDPLAAVLAATMEHLAGLLPAHISFSAAHSSVVQDWRWAAGGHPLAAIGGGLLGGGGASSAHVSSLQQDAMARSFVVTALDEAVATVNRAIAHLAAETTNEDTYAVFKRWERQLAGQYNAVVEGWRRVAAAVEAMDYGGALHLLPGIETAAARWEGEVREVVALLHPARCTKQRRLQVRGGLLPLLCCLSVLLLLLLCVLLRKRKIKPKVN
ncbi:unnamed protein product, partial [Closterium sp. Naga37s-1]